MICRTHRNCRVGLPGHAVPVRVMVGLDPDFIWAETSFDESWQTLGLFISNFEGLQIPDPGSPRRPLHGRSRGRPPHGVLWATWTTNSLSSLFLLQASVFLFLRYVGTEQRSSRHLLYTTFVTTHATITVPAIAAISLFPILRIEMPRIGQCEHAKKDR